MKPVLRWYSRRWIILTASGAGVERNQACYGNINVQATPQSDAADFKFTAPGDIEDIADIQSLILSGLSLPDTWGVMLMSVQANLPDATPGQNVTMLLFGDVTVENRGGAVKPLLLEVTASRNARVRSGPGTQNSQIGSLAAGTTVEADGRNEAGDWLCVVLADGSTGWVSADLVTVNGDKMTLAVVEGTEIAGTTYGPMQAFYFTSGIGDPACTGAPYDGILIQTPEGAGSVDFLINEVQINLGSTAFLQAHASRPETGGELKINVLAGKASIIAQEVKAIVPAGAVGIVPLDENALPNGTPRLEGYDDTTIGTLTPLFTVLPETFEVVEGLTAAAFLPSGAFQFSGEFTDGCAGSNFETLNQIILDERGDSITLTPAASGASLHFVWGNMTSDFTRQPDGTFVSGSVVIVVLSPEQFIYEADYSIKRDGVVVEECCGRWTFVKAG